MGSKAAAQVTEEWMAVRYAEAGVLQPRPEIVAGTEGTAVFSSLPKAKAACQADWRRLKDTGQMDADQPGPHELLEFEEMAGHVVLCYGNHGDISELFPIYHIFLLDRKDF